MTVRRLRPSEGSRLRAVRLRALRDAPYAFASTYASEAAFPDDEWERRAAGSVFVAVDGDAVLGMAGGFFAGDQRAVATLWGMWVDPAARGHGLGGRLVNAVVAWARAEGTHRLELGVTDAADAAAALYRRLGFTETGERHPLESDPALTQATLTRPL